MKAGKFRLDESSVGENVSLHQASIDTTLQINGTSIERQCSLNDGTVNGKALFERTEIGGDVILNNAKLARSWGRVSFEEAVIDGDIQLDPERYLLIGGDTSFEEATIDGEVSLTRQMSVDGGLRINSVSVTTLELHRPEVNGPIDLRGLSAERLRIEPPTVENRHPAINAVTLGGCHVGTAELAPSATGETDDTVVYDIEAGAIETLETRPETVPQGDSLYDYLRLVETDFAEIDFSVHRDQLFRNNWNLHGLREGGERDVLLARAAAYGDFLTEEPDHDDDADDDEAVAARAREWTEAWLEGRVSTTDGLTEEVPPIDEWTGSRANWPPVDDNAAQQPRREPRGGRGIDVDEEIERSGFLSGLEYMIELFDHIGAWLAKLTGSGPVRQSIDHGPRTITLDQLESTYAGAKAAADANGENGVASIFFVREQRYIQLQNRKHIREEFVATYLAVGQSVRRKIASVTDTINSVIRRPRVAGSDAPSELDGSATETAPDEASEFERDTLPEDVATQSTETPHSDGDATATATSVESTVPASSNLRTLRRYLSAWLSNGSLRVFTTYGESPRRVLGWWVGIILTWTWLYYLVAISRVGVANAWEVLVDQGPGFVLLSIGSFTTVIPPIPILPFGDSAVPRYAFLKDDPMITLLSGVEGLLGILFVSLFVLTLTRSIQR